LPDSPDGLRRLWGRRQSFKLRPRQTQLFATLLPRIRIDLPDAPPASIDPCTFFADEPADVSLEIGFGGGEHLTQWAKHHPNEGFLGGEPFINGMAKMLAHIDDEKIANIRLFAGDARRLVEALADQSIARVFLLFPDPWPKKRHHKRRYVQDETLAQISRILKDGGRLRMASDIAGYIEWTLAHLASRPELERVPASLAEPSARPADWPPTRYEQKAIREGRTPVYLDYVRRAR
jgi:tRNA (guanine-N7-)-methyltransferase